MSENGEQCSKKVKGVSLYQVHLKLVGESLEVIQEYDDKLKLRCVCEGKACKVSLSKGKSENSLHLLPLVKGRQRYNLVS